MIEFWLSILGVFKFMLAATLYNPRNWVITDGERLEARSTLGGLNVR